MISKNTTVAKTWKDSQLVANKKDNKRVFIVGDNIIKHLNGYVIGGKTGNCNVYVRSSHDVKIKCMLEHIRSVTRNKLDHIIFHIGTNDIPSDKDAEDIVKQLLTWLCLQKMLRSWSPKLLSLGLSLSLSTP